MLEGGQGRTVFRLSIAMARLEAAFSYETADSPPLGTISVQVLSTCLLRKSVAGCASRQIQGTAV